MMERLARLALDFPRATLAILAAVSGLAALGLPRITTEVGYRGALNRDHPAIERLERLIADFGGGLPIAAVWSCDETDSCETVFDDAALAMAKGVEEKLLGLPLVRRVDSPANSPLLVASEDGFAIRRFVEDGAIARDRDELARQALRDPSWIGSLVSPDGRVGSIVVQLASSESRTTVTVVPALQEALAPFEAQGFRFHLVGDPVDFAIAGGELQRETPKLIPVVVALIGAILWVLFRAWPVVLVALATAGLAVLWAMGAMAWIGWPESEITQALPPQILVIGVCDAIHVLAAYASRQRSRATDTLEVRSESLLAVTREVGSACAITAVITSVGLLSFSSSGFDIFVRFGVIAAVGVASALVLTFTFLPIVLVRLPSAQIRAGAASDAWSAALRIVIDLCARRGRSIVVACGVLLLVCGFGVSRLRVDLDERELLGSESRVVKWAEFVEDHLRKTDTLEIGITLPEGEVAVDPAVITRVEQVVDFLAQQEVLGRTRSFLDPLRRLNQVLHGDDASYDRAADSLAGNAQLLLALRLEESSRLDEWITADQRRIRLSVEAESTSQSRRAEILAAVRGHLQATLPPNWTVELTGPFALYFDFVDEIQKTQRSSFATATVGVIAVFWLFLWITGNGAGVALRWALIGMVPNILPIVYTLGAMGLWDVPLDVGTTMVGAIVLGIATDDTVHVVSQFLDRRKAGLGPREAIAATIRSVGRAVITTSFALSVGFFALMISPWQSIASFGLLSGIAILGALLAELFVLPALIMGFSRAPVELEPAEVSRAPSAAQRRGVGVTVLMAVVVAGSVVGPEALRSEATARPACWIFPNGHVPLFGALDAGCRLEGHDQIEAVEVRGEPVRVRNADAMQTALAEGSEDLRVRVRRSGERIWTHVAAPIESHADRGAGFATWLLLCVSLVGGSLFLLAYSSAPAAAPLAGVASCLGVVLLYALCGRSPEISPLLLLAALGFAPAVTAHLALSFPHTHRLPARVPATVPMLYGSGAGAAALLVWGYVRFPLLLRTAEWMSICALIAAYAWLLGGSVLACRAAGSALERARARAAVSGTIAVAAASAIAFLAAKRLGIGAVTPLGAGVFASLAVPFGYAIARYQLNDLRPHIRQWVLRGLLRVVYAGALATLIYAAVARYADRVHTDPVAVLALSFVVLLATTTLASALWRVLRAWIPTVGQRLRTIEADHALRAAQLRDADQAAEITAEALHDGLRATGICLFVAAGQGLRLAAARGPRPVIPVEIAEAAARELAREEPVHFALEGGEEGWLADRMRELGVSILASLRSSGELVGVALVSTAENELPYTREEIIFVDSVASRAAVAIHNARLTEGLLQAERFATIGQVAAGLAHDLGKPIAVILQRARSMLRNPGYPVEVREHADSIAGLAEEAFTSLDRLFEQGRRESEGSAAGGDFSSLIHRAVQAVSCLHPDARASVRLAPDLPCLRGGPDLLRVVVNLLDNAVLASDAGEVVEVVAACREGALVIEVVDHGCGMDAPTLARAFEPFFTTRSPREGRGLGLATSRVAVESLGGRLVLESEPGRGTTARILLPLTA